MEQEPSNKKQVRARRFITLILGVEVDAVTAAYCRIAAPSRIKEVRRATIPMTSRSVLGFSRRSLGAALLSLAGAGVLLLSAGCSRPAPASDAEEVVRIREMYDGYRQGFPNTPGISAEELMSLRPEGSLVIVDVREPEEQQVSMIPGAIRAKDFEAARETYRDSQIVVYCTIGARSGRYAAELLEDGFEVRNLEGSILSWTHAGGALVGPSGPTKEVHVYGPTWNLAADGYHAVW